MPDTLKTFLANNEQPNDKKYACKALFIRCFKG